MDGRADDLAAALMPRELVLPDLERRTSLFEVLVEHFVRRAAAHYRKDVVGLSDEAMRQLAAAPLPGNIGQLEMILDNAVARASDEIIDVEDLF
jgi:DNA-binding NtrC family response regulator